MIIVNGRIETTAEAIAALKDAVATMEAASRAEAGCDDYTFSVELNNPNAIRITERWEDMAALEAHMGTPHMAEFQKAMAAHPPKASQVYFYEATEVPRPGSR
ncbi:MAG: hypothetical protein ETSY1_15705 [Candidatus Entotheonella factor]|uniref:ABM domain-containing protein n=1 Tax=Entotheonella factor TaxID=1429438 RepID=W4LPA4_ENTF1|nr:putative quinol monooxygenase [Candidatus Entotheonella palauensis]ETW99246.1 MAG: hypothetical protein ETSY1_15705 [Candidatus Entotheonella factor]